MFRPGQKLEQAFELKAYACGNQGPETLITLDAACCSHAGAWEFGSRSARRTGLRRRDGISHTYRDRHHIPPLSSAGKY